MELLGWFYLITIGLVGMWFGCKVGDPPRHWSLYYRERWYQVPVGWFLVLGGFYAVALNSLMMLAVLGIVPWRVAWTAC